MRRDGCEFRTVEGSTGVDPTSSTSILLSLSRVIGGAERGGGGRVGMSMVSVCSEAERERERRRRRKNI